MGDLCDNIDYGRFHPCTRVHYYTYSASNSIMAVYSCFVCLQVDIIMGFLSLHQVMLLYTFQFLRK